ncbi:MAG TPA: hypothetical protein VGN34_03375 [Ktedonobacteraceae bacterium]|jgi:hypothetical protein
MIIVVEGPSAVGKTSLLRIFPASQVVGEEWEALGIPRGSGPEKPQSKEAQAFWVELHTRRWQKLLATETSLGNAYADTDPVKLYYNFALVKLGYMERDVFEEGFVQTEQAFLQSSLGFADHVIVLSAPPDVLLQRKNADASRQRGHFHLHARLGSLIKEYYTVAKTRYYPNIMHAAAHSS